MFRCLDYDAAIRAASKVEYLEQKERIRLHFEFDMEGAEEKKEVVYECLRPHPEFPEYLLVCGRYRVSGEEEREKEYTLTKFLSRSLPPVQVGKKNLVGIMGPMTGEALIPFSHAIYEPVLVNKAPIAREHYHPYYTRGDLMRRKTNRHMFFRHNYIPMEDGVYEAIGDPLVDIVEGRFLEKKEHLFEGIDAEVPFYGAYDDFTSKFPKYIYKGYLPMYFYGEGIGLNAAAYGGDGRYSGKLIIPTKTSTQRVNQVVSTWKEFRDIYEPYGNYKPEDFDWMERLYKVYDEERFGNKKITSR